MSTEIGYVDDLSDDLENWMSKLPERIRQTPLVNISIPGSHDSFTNKITSNSDISPDAEELVKELSNLGQLLKEVIARWSITQTYTAQGQLERGIRYFDIRTSTKDGTDVLYTCHSLYSGPIQDNLDEINSFLNSHPKEIVFLDFQHCYQFDSGTHAKYIASINSTFGSKILPNIINLASTTLESMSQSGYQVIVIYREASSNFFPKYSFPNPWPNTIDIPKLINSLNEGLLSRNANLPFISQCVLTPDADFLLGHLLGSLKESCAIDLEKDRSTWIENQKAGTGGLNLIIADFIEISDCEYPKKVINVNKSLLS